MKKVVIHRPGGYDRLRMEEHPDPKPGPGEVLLDVEAIGINYADCVTRMGLYASAKEYVGYPITPGFEVAGTVAATGADVSSPRAGTRVIGLTRFGGYATQLTVPSHQIFPVPSGMGIPEAAGFTTVFLTAWYALFELSHPHPGDSVLVHSAAGGVGTALVQLGKLAGCRVVGVVGAPHKVKLVSKLGADAVIDKSSSDLWREAHRLSPGGYEIILDANGVSTLRESYQHLASPGKLVIYGFHSMLPKEGGQPSWPGLLWRYWRTPRFGPLRMTTQNRSLLAFNLSFLFDKTALLTNGIEQLLDWIEHKRIHPAQTITYPFEHVADAHRALESGQTVGKLVLVTSEKASY